MHLVKKKMFKQSAIRLSGSLRASRLASWLARTPALNLCKNDGNVVKQGES